jgi:L-2-hydroxyglutarate oxidase
MAFDFCIIGGGIVGLSTARELLRVRPDAKILLLEKEAGVALHQTGHNSGVIHAGIYYAPGSLKANLCREGLRATKEFCDEYNIPYQVCGKLIVATNPIEEKRIDDLFDRATSNGLKLKKVNQKVLSEIEPNIVGTKAILSEETGIVNYTEIASKISELLIQSGCELRFNTQVTRIVERIDQVEIGCLDGTWFAKKLIVCGGLQSDRLAKLAGLELDFRIIPFRGEYFQLPSSKNNIVKHLIYPAPDPGLPFLGVHLTKMIDGSVTVGPNAVLGMAREGYERFSLNPGDLSSILGFSGFWKLIWKHRFHAIHELKGSVFKQNYLKDCRKYCPQLEISDLLPYRAGIRAQVVTSKGEAVHDFMFGETERMLHVLNAPSPAATSAIPIGRMIVEKILNK